MKRHRSPHDTPTNEFEQIPKKKKKTLQVEQDFIRLASLLGEVAGESTGDINKPLRLTITLIRERIKLVEEGSGNRVKVTEQIIMHTRGLVKSLGSSNKHSVNLSVEANTLAEKIGFKER